MAKIARLNANVKAFGSNATGTNRTVFGDVAQSDTLDANVTADFLTGWEFLADAEPPAREDMNAVLFTISQLTAYLYQMGIAEWNAIQEYHANSLVNYGGLIYVSLQNTNVNHTPTDSDAWWKNPLIAKAGAQDITGTKTVKTGSKLVLEDAPAAGTDAANKTYVDGRGGRSAFTANGAWVCPAGVTLGFVTLQGPGGGGAGGGNNDPGNWVGGGGAGGNALVEVPVVLTPGTSYSFEIPAGGAGGAVNANGATPSDTIFRVTAGATLLTASAGDGGDPGDGGAAFGSGGAIGPDGYLHGTAGQNGSSLTGGAGGASGLGYAGGAASTVAGDPAPTGNFGAGGGGAGVGIVSGGAGQGGFGLIKW